MRLSGSTVVCGIVGDPVEHSMSPAMQNEAFRRLNLDYVYVPFRVPRGAVSACTAAMRSMGIRGLNVTVPHKVDIMQFLDWVDPGARRIGAVNTVVNDGGVLRGYNTDADGFLRGLERGGIDVRGARVVLLGAGGASRAVTLVLADAGAVVTVLNRDAGRAEALAADVSRTSGRAVSHGPLTDSGLAAGLREASLLVNATTVGMHPNARESLVRPEYLRPDMCVCDIVYNPPETRLLSGAAARGCLTIGGVEMLVAQGALAFELWTGSPAPVDAMRAVVHEELARGEH